MRKKNYLTKLNYKDERLCSVVKNSQHISQAQALLLVSRNRILSYEKQGVLRRLYYMDKNKNQIVYELTPKGRDFIVRNFSNLRGNFYTSSTAVQHNITLSQQIIDHPYREWLTERDLKEILVREIEQSDNRWELMRMLENGEISVPDAGFINEDGSLEAVEVINENYTSSHLACKDRFQEITKIPITYIRQN